MLHAEIANERRIALPHAAIANKRQIASLRAAITKQKDSHRLTQDFPQKYCHCPTNTFDHLTQDFQQKYCPKDIAIIDEADILPQIRKVQARKKQRTSSDDKVLKKATILSYAQNIQA